MNAHATPVGAVAALMFALIAAACGADPPEADTPGHESPGVAPTATQTPAWTRFCDKADPDALAARLGASALAATEDVFAERDGSDALASGACGGTFEFEPGNSVPFQIALRVYDSPAAAAAALDQWREADTAGPPANEVGSRDGDLWIVHRERGSLDAIDGSIVHDSYRITVTASYPVYEESDGCGDDGPDCTDDPADLLRWFASTYLPDLTARIDAALE